MNKHKTVIKEYFKSIVAFQAIEREPKDFGTGDLLYSSEIHTLVAIAKYPGCNLTELASALDITKGGAGKFVKKLLAKDLIIKTRHQDNKKEVIFYTTAKGKTAYRHHADFERQMFGEIYQTLDTMSTSQVQVLEDFLVKLNQILSNNK